MKHKSRLFIVILAAALITGLPGTMSFAADPKTSGKASATQGDAWAEMPAILKRIVPPKFPKREFDITKYGAVGDGTTDCTTAFRKAIDACHRAKGGRVVVPAGTFLTGAIHLKSGVNLHVTKDATIRFSTNVNDYLPPVFARFECTELMNYSPFIYALRQQNIAITGAGTIDGQASAGPWHKWKEGRKDINALLEMANNGVPVEQRVFGAGHQLRPNFVQLLHCRNILIEGIRIIDSPMWVLNPTYCTNVTIRNVTVDVKGVGYKAPNTDGCDPDACTDVLIENCTFNCDDDCIAIKSGRDRDGRRVNIICQNIIVRNCQFKAGHGGVTAGSETAAGIRNIFAENCTFDSPNLRMAIRLKTNPKRGGFVENFHVRNCTVQTAETGIHMTMKYDKTSEGEAIPHIRNVNVHNVNFEKLKQAIFIEGLSPEHPVTDVTIANCNFGVTEKASVITNAVNVRLVDVQGGGLETRSQNK